MWKLFLKTNSSRKSRLYVDQTCVSRQMYTKCWLSKSQIAVSGVTLWLCSTYQHLGGYASVSQYMYALGWDKKMKIHTVLLSKRFTPRPQVI